MLITTETKKIYIGEEILGDVIGNGMKPPAKKSADALDLEARGWREWYAAIFGQSFVDVLAPHHEQAIEWHWNSRKKLIDGEKPDYLAYFSIWSRGNMKTTLARCMTIADAALSIGEGGSYALIVGGTTKKVRGTAKSLETMLTNDRLKNYYPELSEVKKNERGGSKGWTADFINTAAGAVFHFIGLDEGVAGANIDNLRPTFIIPDDIDDREDSPVIAEARFQTFTRGVLPTRQQNTLVFFAQNLISRYSVMYRIYKQRARVLTNRLNTAPIPAVVDLETEVKTVGGIVKDVYLSGTPTWKAWDVQRIQDEIDSYGLEAFKRECQHEVDESTEGLILKKYNDDVHVISESEFASVYGSLSAWQTWAKWNYNDWSRTKTDKHANVAGYITVSSQNTAFPGATFVMYPLSFVANSEPEDVAERMLSVLSPFAYSNVTWEQLRKDEITRSNASLHTRTVEEETRFKREVLAKIIPRYSKPLLELYNVKRGVMSHSEDTVRAVYNRAYGFNFSPANPGKFDAYDDMNRAMAIDFALPHPFRADVPGYTRFFVVVPDDQTDENPRIINNKIVRRPLIYPDAMTPHELFDSNLLRYQFKNYRMRDTVLTTHGESDDTPLKLNDDFPQALQMVYFKNLLVNIELSEAEQFAVKMEAERPELTESSILAEDDPALQSQKWIAHSEERAKFQKEKAQDFDQSDPFAQMFAAQGLDEDMSWINNL